MTAYDPARRSVPHFVYRCYDANDRLLYVGCSNNPGKRVADHIAHAIWGQEVAYVRNLVFPNRDAALTRERRAIHDECPAWNVKGRWRMHDSRDHWTAADYATLHRAVRSLPMGCDPTLLLVIEAEAARRYGVALLSSKAAS